jgi:hypothetical protein
MDRNNPIGRRERFEILKILHGLGEGVVAVDKGQLKPLRPNTILRALEESIARRNREGNVSTLDEAVAAFNSTERRKGKTIIRVRP